MADNKNKNQQEEQLKKLKEKSLPENIRKSVDDKIKHLKKPFNK